MVRGRGRGHGAGPRDRELLRGRGGPDVAPPPGSYLTHEASGLDEHGEAREAFLNGGDGHKRKEEFFI